ncbi:Twitching mobility protein [Wohlfahrtiimonas chitiniclastica SH04]|uniref:Twitching mobility protein n=1 Tax=Wohlfahrtiimonas chitiniclastica SH04 TaxID=1261130 RepID=L8XWR9_9GAMM|nr:PilT/PilU family type 4a pilus ATPase [Wohlfahrtiimonas chitiniclastica]ELV08352.1 Twitching mobility protein [Wohlfahrtiimonas chitiniclastica SH04]
MDISPFLRFMVQKNGSDLFMYPNAPVCVKLSGVVHPLSRDVLSAETVKVAIFGLLSEAQAEEFVHQLELNFAIKLEDGSRFRVNIFKQRGEYGMVIRYIKSVIPKMEDLRVPEVFKQIIMEKRGLVLVVGSTGSGKSTSLASMIDYRASHSPGHILTVEDPIEFVYQHKKSIIGQREVGLDTHSYENALQSAMREAPDVILVGEVRSTEIMKAVINFSITGHLCLTTLHANNAVGALDRIVNFFPESARAQLLVDLSLNIKAIVSQRLVKGLDGKLVPAVEVMLNTPYVQELIMKGKLDTVPEAMENGGTTGMRTFDQALYELYREGLISAEEAINNADSKNNVSLRIRMGENRAVTRDDIRGEAKFELKQY